MLPMIIMPSRVIRIPAQGPPQMPPFTPSYLEKVMGTNPLAVWTLGDASGSVATEIIRGWHGTYSNVTLGQTGIGDGRTSINCLRTSSPRVNLYSAELAGAINFTAGGLMVWDAMTTWVDGNSQYVAIFAADGNNEISMFKSSINNRIDLFYDAGSAIRRVNITGQSSNDFQCYGMSWDKNAGASGELKGFLNGAQTGTTQVSLGTWAGALLSSKANLATFAGASNFHSGNMQMAVLWAFAPTPATFARLGVAP